MRHMNKTGCPKRKCIIHINNKTVVQYIDALLPQTLAHILSSESYQLYSWNIYQSQYH